MTVYHITGVSLKNWRVFVFKLLFEKNKPRKIVRPRTSVTIPTWSWSLNKNLPKPDAVNP